jgi:hypothetical protein
MGDRKRYFRITFVVLLALVMLLCSMTNAFLFPAGSYHEDALAQAFTFVPQITPAQYHTEEPPTIATLVYESLPWVELEKGALYSPTYKWVSCRGIEDYEGHTCYEVCYGGKCFFVSDKDSRVSLYVDLVKERETKIGELEILDRNTFDVIADIVGDCLEGTAGGLVIYSLFSVAVADPEPVTKGFVTGLTAVGTIAYCGKSIWNGFSQKADKDDIIEDINEATTTAIGILLDLEKYPPE